MAQQNQNEQNNNIPKKDPARETTQGKPGQSQPQQPQRDPKQAQEGAQRDQQSR